MMKSVFSNLRTAAALIVLSAAVLVMGLALARNLEQRNLAAQDTQDEVLRLARVAASSQQESIDDVRRLLTVLADVPEVRDGEQRACSSFLEKIYERNARYTNLGVIDLDGNVVCSALPHSGTVNLADRSYFRRALATRNFAIGDYQIGRITGQPGINFGYPMFSESGNVQGVVFAALDLGWLSQLAADFNLEEEKVLFAMDRQGTILNRYPDGGEWVGRELPGDPLIEEILASDGEGTAEMEGLDDVSRVYAYTSLEADAGTGAYVVMGIPTAAAYAAANRDLTRSLVGLGILALLFLAVSWAYADLFILRRVRALAQAARRLTGNEMSARTGLPHDAGEFGELARTFDEMAEILERRMRRLQALNAIDRAITARYVLPKTLDVVLEQVMGLLPVDAAAILLLNRDTGYLEHAAGRGFNNSDMKGSRLKMGEGYGGRVALERQPVFIRDLDGTAGFLHAPLIEGEQFVSYCGVPLLAEGEIHGVLSVFGRTRLDFDEEWVTFLKSLALQAAIAIDNSRLLERTREQARQMRQMVDTMPEGVWLLDSRQRVLLANPLGQHYLSELAGASIGDVITTLGDVPPESLLGTVREEQPWHELIPPGGERIFEIAGQPVKDDGQLKGWVVVLRDVSEERQRQTYVQTQERLATLGQTAAGIVHDFNNILSVISIHSQVLARYPEHPKRERFLNTIGEQAQLATDVVSQILDFSRTSEMEPRPLDLQAFVEEQTKLLKHILPSSVKVTMTVAPGEHMAEVDPTRLQQVLMNLAVNARDAMSEKGRLHIGLSRLSVTLAEEAPLPDMETGEYECLSVSDSGPGIPQDVLPHIFEPFFTTKPRGHGTGLGLAQVYGLVKHHGGVIDVQSKPGEGTTFTIYLLAITEPEERILAADHAYG